MQALVDNVVQRAVLNKASVDAVVYKAMADDAEAGRAEMKSMYDKVRCIFFDWVLILCIQQLYWYAGFAGQYCVEG
jgi:hypothetical protein